MLTGAVLLTHLKPRKVLPMLTAREWIFLAFAAVALVFAVFMLLHCQQLIAAPSTPRVYYVNDALRIEAEDRAVNIQFRQGDDWWTAGRIAGGVP